MINKVCNIDEDAPLSTIEVRDALIQCFKEAHNDILNETFGGGGLSTDEADHLKEVDIELLVQELFQKVHGDYEHPTKGSLIAVLEKLKEFALSFRAEEVVRGHYATMMELISRLP